MRVIDGHCDVLYKMFLQQDIDFYKDDPRLKVTYAGMKKANMLLQFFAVFLPETLSPPTFDHIVQYIDIFHNKVLNHPDIVFVKNSRDLTHVFEHNKIGALLSLEGVDALAGHLAYLRVLYYLGVRAVGITWNEANWAADGVMEPRKGGFTKKGKLLVNECNQTGLIMDVSHLSIKAFWELAELSSRPFIASHSNAYAVCPHPRNLNDDQIKAIIQVGGQIGITFVPHFLHGAATPSMTHIVRHIEHVCSLGGAYHLGFGSDFDGFTNDLPGLERVEKYNRLADQLCKYYQSDLVERWLYQNWYNFLQKQLPE